MNISKFRFSSHTECSAACIPDAVMCCWLRGLPDGVLMSVFLTRLMSTAEGHNTRVPAGDSETVAVVSSAGALLIPGPVGNTDCYVCTCYIPAHSNLH